MIDYVNTVLFVNQLASVTEICCSPVTGSLITVVKSSESTSYGPSSSALLLWNVNQGTLEVLYLFYFNSCLLKPLVEFCPFGGITFKLEKVIYCELNSVQS
jgi:hypothetical protein